MTEGLEPAHRGGGRGRIAAGAGGRKRGWAGAVVGGIVGLAAAGVAAGMAAERVLVRRRRGVRPDPYVDEPFGDLPADEYRTVTTAEGVPLHVEITGSNRARTTVVFVHGFCLDMGTFHFQRKAMHRLDGMRTVSYDQPGHGRSGRLPKGEYTLEMLGSALRKVIDECVPRDSTVVLVGHSMGGMTIMALADLMPELFGKTGRVGGAVLVSTSAGGVTFGLPDLIVRFRERLLPLISSAGTASAIVLDRSRAAASNLAWLLTRKYGFGTTEACSSLVSYVEQMNSATPSESVARYLRCIYGHSHEPAVGPLKGVPVLIVCGEDDQVTPVEHSRLLAQALPHAELAVIPGAGHVALLEHNEAVNTVLLAFVRKIGA